MSKLQRYFLILAVWTISVGVLYYFLQTLPADAMKGALLSSLLAFLYMPAPLYSYMINQSLSKESYAVNKFFDKAGFTWQNVLLTIGMLALWLVLVLVFTFVLGKIWPTQFGVLLTDAASVANHIKSISGAENATSLPFGPFPLVLISFATAIIAGFTINLLFALGEEIGWRGYLMKEFAHLSFVKRNALIGAIWGIWHAPIIIQGYNYGSTLALPGVAMFTIFCMGFAFAFGVLADKTKNVFFSGALHGMFNAIAGIFILVVANYHPFFGGAIGILGTLCWILVAYIVARVIRLKVT